VRFAFTLVVTSRRMHLYTPARLTNFLHEQRLSAQACFTSGLLLTGTLYLVHGHDIPAASSSPQCCWSRWLSVRGALCTRAALPPLRPRLDTRNVLIVGTGPEAQALRHHLDSIKHLGYTFKGFIELPGSVCHLPTAPNDVVGTLDSSSRTPASSLSTRSFLPRPVNAESCRTCWSRRAFMAWICAWFRTVRRHARGSAIEYIGQFPTMPLHRGEVPELGLLFKRVFDTVFPSCLCSLFRPAPGVAIAIKLDSPGPVFYTSERIGKKGMVFRCTKFRTMVRDADKRRAEIMHMNERDGVLFKSRTTRASRLGRFLRKYSLDELPQFFNVLVAT